MQLPWLGFDSSDMKRLVIIGAGLSGISAARMLKDHLDVVILERTTKPGGLVKCDTVDGILFHKVGGHVFNSKNKDVLRWFWKHFDQKREFIHTPRNAKILLDGKYIGYPLENYLYQLDPRIMSDIFEDLLGINAGGKKKMATFDDFLKTNFGSTLYSLYFSPYNLKLWNTDLSKIPLDWLDDKLPMPNLHQIIMSNIKHQEETEMVHSTFFYPKNNGSQYIINKLAEGLNIQCNTAVRTIEPKRNRLVINGEIEADYIVYTGDVRQLNKICRIADSTTESKIKKIVNLKSNGTSNVLCKTDKMELTWLYLPSASVKVNRIIYTGNFSPSNNGHHQSLTCVVEFSGKYEKNVIIEEIKKLPGHLQPIAFNYEKDAYVIQDNTTRDHIRELREALAKHHIYLLGRFAEWEYYNMDKCIESAMNIQEEVLNALKEEYSQEGSNRLATTIQEKVLGSKKNKTSSIYSSA